MKIIDKNIDNAKAFDWGLTSNDYAKYRDIYPEIFYQKIIENNLCVKGQSVLDVGTGTGVLPRNMAKFGAKWTCCDISENQIEMAKILSKGLDIEYFVKPTEALDFAPNSFDVITACQCFFYFDHAKTADVFYNLLKPHGKILVLYMQWLSFEDKIAKASEDLVLKYNPVWTGHSEVFRPAFIPEDYNKNFTLSYKDEYRLPVHFTKESWNGRIKSCRGIGASLDSDKIELWEKEHKAMLDKIAPDEFDIAHYVAMAVLEKR